MNQKERLELGEIYIDNDIQKYHGYNQTLNSKYISNTYVATDDKKILDYSKKLGAKVPFLRDKNYAKDTSTRNHILNNTPKLQDK